MKNLRGLFLTFCFLATTGFSLAQAVLDDGNLRVKWDNFTRLDSIIDLNSGVSLNFGLSETWSVVLFDTTAPRPVNQANNNFKIVRLSDWLSIPNFVQTTVPTNDTLYQTLADTLPGSPGDSIYLEIVWWLDGQRGLMAKIGAKIVSTRYALWSVRFPDLAMPPLGTTGEDDQLLLPSLSGILLSDPFDVNKTFHGYNDNNPYNMVDTSVAAGLDGQYPAKFIMQFMAYYDNAGGIYFQLEDTTGRFKRFIGKAELAFQKLFLGAEHVRENCDVIIDSMWWVPDIINLKPFQGDWFDAAMIYRDWATQQWWTNKGVLQNRPEDYDAVNLWLALDLIKMGMQEGWELVDTFARFFSPQASILIHPRGWGTMVPTPSLPLGFQTFVDSALAHNYKVAPYTGTRWWKDSLCDIYPTCLSGHAVNLDGASYYSTLWEGYAMHLMDTLWQQHYLSVVDMFLQTGVTDIYVDNVPNAKLDWGGTRPKGGGSSWMDGFRMLLDTVINLGESVNPDIHFYQEGKVETELGLMDGLYAANWELAIFNPDYVKGGGNPVPLIAAVYGDYIGFNAGSLFLFGDTLTNVAKWRLVQGYSFLYANSLGIFVDSILSNGTITTEQLEAYVMVRDLLGLERNIFKWKNFGRYMRPPSIVSDSVNINFPITATQFGVRTVPAVYTAAFTLNNEAAFLFMNHTDIAQNITVNIDLQQYTTYNNRWLATPDSFYFMDNVGTSINESLTLPPRSALSWVITDSVYTAIKPSDIRTPYELKVYPNVSNSKVHISFLVPETDHITLQLLDVMGRKISTIVDEQFLANRYSIEFDIHDLTQGIYLIQLESIHTTQTRKILKVNK